MKQAENSVYIVDGEYRIVHFNQVLAESFPSLQIGDICYQALCREDAPCKNCPLSNAKSDNGIFYNRVSQRFVEVSAGNIFWPGAGACSVIISRRIHEGNKNLLYNLANFSAYDDLLELNLQKDQYWILYHTEGKYAIPAREGKLTQMIWNASNNFVHPDDREAFLRFWDLGSLISRLRRGTQNRALEGEFRKKRMDGSYCWVLQTVVVLSQEEQGEPIVMCFIRDIDEQKKNFRQYLESVQNTALDPLTGLYKRSFFFKQAEEFLRKNSGIQYCLMAIDIEHFKLFNEWYGQEAGDKFLISIGERLKAVQDAEGGLAGYMGGDDFVIILPNHRELMWQLENQITGYAGQVGGNAGFLPAFGIYEITGDDISVSTMYDRASIALSSVKGNYAKRACWYDAGMSLRMEENHILLTEVQRALANGEFTFYAQPKCDMTTGKIIGLESLVRWNHPHRGVISPAEFIPVLEKNGFITDLDLYIWDMVCRRLRAWIDAGHRPVPISVNVSRVDIYTLDVPKVFKSLTDKYGLETRLLEVEITESAYAEEYHMITSVVEALRKAGFAVLMDDFGSGYSSLNMLKDINVDVLKIDMKFLEMNEQSAGKGLGILEAIVSMARLIGMRLIAEGVENKEQVDFLLNMGCIYGQGYYFYRPMPVETMEAFLADENNVDFRGIKARRIERFRMRELLNENVFSESMLNNILGGIAFYDVDGERVELIRVNENYQRIVGTSPVDLEEQRKRIIEKVRQEDRGIVLGIFDCAYKNPHGGAEGDFRRIKGDGSMIWIHLHAYFLREQDGHKIYYGAVSDVTAQKRLTQPDAALLCQNQELWMAGRKMESILRQADINGWDWDIKNNTLTMLMVSHQDELSKKFKAADGSQAVIRDFPEICRGQLFTGEQHRKTFEAFIDQVYSENTASCELPMKGENGSVFWVRVVSETIRDESGTPVRAVGFYMDITKEKQEQAKSRENMKALELLRKQSLLDFKICLTKNTVAPGEKYGDYWLEGIDTGLMTSYDQMVEQVAKKLVLPEYKEMFRRFMGRDRMIQNFKDGKQMEVLEYQRLYNQKPKWMKMLVHLVQFDDTQDIYAYIFVMDIDDQKQQEMELTKLAERDSLTGLYNRQAIPKIKSYLNSMGDSTAALIMFDLDNFKLANDIFGHAYGDAIIAQNAWKLKNFFRGEDIVCRIGGDEFLVLCKNISEVNMARKLADIMAAMNTVCCTEEQRLKFSASAGYAMIPSQGTEFEDLYEKADIALFGAKMNGKGSFEKYDPSMKAIRYELADKE